ncbi:MULTISPECIES: UDP-galactopyranose mutase [Shewanella]|uniref:UDP-galactopyranose mutase n=1 Tax=Shewanella fidelis TaxID=173509 RepID=A0AAW8NQX7_9GAMM|nr:MULTISPECIES: UDP-galactopyranose mutase [Shewanella]MDR8525190.1 UDP-galactopyranose mutase [Shewanella fidelis]MDW4811261.1 UDP-galactopyranose mutase [Shewanella fidelis]MDW4814960.1 UDP-galactopyranose mutase [Shewanella fidelis]MDW4819050.1 UDP-galactopyranose mutase [Shewanella fidelis]MDW4823273.1 UDP-galactopyranose mutase [Shewanella fidelis]
MPLNIAIAGAGFSGAVIANELAQAGHTITVYEPRTHIAGNCYSARDEATQIMLHHFGPHIFHTDKAHIWDYVTQLGEFKPFVNRVKAVTQGQVYSLPINLHTINQFFNKQMSPDEAKAFIASQADKGISEPQNFEQQAQKMIGESLYQAFFKHYTIKQWGRSPDSLPASILKRLPLRFNYDDNYFNHPYQGMPADGYTALVEKLLDHPNINVQLNSAFNAAMKSQYAHVFFSGPLDAYFDYQLGRLPYRTLDFVKETHDGDYQGNAVINYCDSSQAYTRISEHKHFAPWEEHNKTVIFKEYSREATEDDTPYYPVRLSGDNSLLERYIDLAKQEKDITFVGRLGTYCYLDMDVTIDQALNTSKLFLTCLANGQTMPVFTEQ